MTWLILVAIGVTATAAAIDGLRSNDSGRTTSEAADTAAASATSTQPSEAGNHRETGIPHCQRAQLVLVIEYIDMPVAILRHRLGDLCREPDGPITVTIRAAAGRGKGLLLGPEGRFGGLYSQGVEEIAGFRYSPECGEAGPFRATVRFRGYEARRRIPVLRCGIGQGR
jgi:hypothetical protein